MECAISDTMRRKQLPDQLRQNSCPTYTDTWIEAQGLWFLSKYTYIKYVGRLGGLKLEKLGNLYQFSRSKTINFSPKIWTTRSLPDAVEDPPHLVSKWWLIGTSDGASL